MIAGSLVVPLLATVWCGLVQADYLGPRYPYPTDFSSETSLIAGSWKNFTSQLDSIIQNATDPTGAAYNNLTFSIGLFSTRDLDAAITKELQYHHTAAEAADSPVGVDSVDGDSIYPVASITKLVTIYAALLNLDSADWELPLTYFFPQLVDTPYDPTQNIQWDTVTVWSLAAHLSGVALNPYPLADLTAQASVTDLTDPELTQQQLEEFAISRGLPPLSVDDIANLALGVTEEGFEADEVVAFLSQRPPRFLPWANPGYSNNAYILFTPILQNLTGKPIDQVFRETLFDPLGMANTSPNPPPESEWSKYVILGEADAQLLQLPPTLTATSGAIRSSIHELALLGTSILNSTLLAADQTRRWMKPITHTDRLEGSVGAPWEIVRYTHKATGTVTDVYCKSGDSGSASSFLCMMPEFDAGFTMLAASATLPGRTALVGAMGNLVLEAYLPALMAQAKLETQAHYVGNYKSNIEGLNSYLTVSLNETEGALPGLVITEFISNNTDVYAGETAVLARRRLQPTIEDRGASKIAFRTPSPRVMPPGNAGLLATLGSADWIASGISSWGNEDTDLFVFEVDAQGRAIAVNPAAFRVRLERFE